MKLKNTRLGAYNGIGVGEVIDVKKEEAKGYLEVGFTEFDEEAENAKVSEVANISVDTKKLVDDAKTEAEKIISDAKIEADKILSEAKTEAEKIVTLAKANADAQAKIEAKKNGTNADVIQK